MGVLPSKCRPERDEDVDCFANLLASYLEVSFELEEQPGQRFDTSCGCRCPLCRRLAFAGHLKTKKVTSSDKRSANVLLRQRLRALAGELAVALDDAHTERLAARGVLLEQLALLAWTHELLRRAEGHPSGPEVLALWRLFAWTPEGSPRKGFTLTAAKILAAEAEVVVALRAGP